MSKLLKMAFPTISDIHGNLLVPYRAQIVKATDLEARRMSAAENLQREGLSAIEIKLKPTGRSKMPI